MTGSLYNFPDSYGNIRKGSSFPTVGTIPQAVTKTGWTFKSTGKAVRGTGTEFTKLIQGSFLYSGSELRQIDYVVSDTLLFLKQGFSSDISAALPVKIVERQYFKMVTVDNTHATDSAMLQEAPFAAGARSLTGGAPLSYNATYGTLAIEAHW